MLAIDFQTISITKWVALMKGDFIKLSLKLTCDLIKTSNLALLKFQMHI